MFQNLSLKGAGIGAITGILSACASILALLAYLWFIGFFSSVTLFQQIFTMITDIFIKAIVVAVIAGFFVGMSSALWRFYSRKNSFPMIFIVVSVMFYLLHALSPFSAFLNSHSMSILLSKKDVHLLMGFEDGVIIFLSVCIFSCFLVCQYLLYKYVLPANPSISTEVHSVSS